MTGITDKGLVDILVAEDNEGDRIIIEQAFKNCERTHRVHFVGDGVEALEFLKKQNKYKQVPDVKIMILDINLPRRSGMDVLQEIRNTPELKHLPIIILTSSRSYRDVMNFYQNYANCFLTKPIRLNEFNDLLKGVIHFWLELVQLPN